MKKATVLFKTILLCLIATTLMMCDSAKEKNDEQTNNQTNEQNNSQAIDLQSIVFIRHENQDVTGTNRSNIYKLTADKTLTRITSESDYYFHFDLSPDRTKIVMEKRDGLYIMNSDGTNETKIPNTTQYDESPVFSPSGNTLLARYYNEDDYENTITNVFTINIDGTNRSIINTTEENFGDMCYTIDGSQIVATTNTGIVILNTDGTLAATVYSDTEDVYSYSPAISPDGKCILFIVYDETTTSENLYKYNVETAETIQFTHTTNTDFDAPYISNDNQTIVFSRDGALWSMNIDGTNEQKLTTPDSNYYDFDPIF